MDDGSEVVFRTLLTSVESWNCDEDDCEDAKSTGDDEAEDDEDEVDRRVISELE
jgi:hypothetical protein